MSINLWFLGATAAGLMVLHLPMPEELARAVGGQPQ